MTNAMRERIAISRVGDHLSGGNVDASCAGVDLKLADRSRLCLENDIPYLPGSTELLRIQSRVVLTSNFSFRCAGTGASPIG